MDFTDPPDTPLPDFDDEGIEIAEDIMEIDDELLEEVDEEKPVKVGLKPPPMPPVPELPQLVARNTGDIPFVYVAEPEKAYALPFANDLKDYAVEVEKQTPPLMLQRYAAMAPAMPDTLSRDLYLYMAGSIAELSGDMGGALKNYGIVLDGSPALRPNLWAVRSLISQKGLLEKTEMLFGVELKHEEEPNRLASLLYLRGIENEAIGNFDKAETLYRESLDHRPSYTLPLLALTRLREIATDTVEAADLCYEIAGLVDEPEIKAAYLTYAVFLSRRNGNYVKAEEWAREALPLDPLRASDLWFERETCARLQSDMAGLYALLKEKSLAQAGSDAGEATALYATVIAERDLSDLDDAFTFLSDYREAHPSELLDARLLQLAARMGRWDAVLAREGAVPWMYRAAALLRTGETTESVEFNGPESDRISWLMVRSFGAAAPGPYADVAEALGDDPGAYPFFMFAALAALSGGEDPWSYLEKALALDTSGEALILAYYAAIKASDEDRARALLVQWGPSSPWAPFMRAELGRHFAAKGDFAGILALEETFGPEEFTTPLERGLAAESALVAGREDIALPLLTQLAAECVDPREQLYYTLMASRLQSARGAVEEALGLLDGVEHLEEMAGLRQLLAREYHRTDRLERFLEEGTEPADRLELAFRRQTVDADPFLGIDTPEARWQAAKRALTGTDGVLFQEIMDRVADDYPEARGAILTKAAMELADIFQGPAPGAAERAYTEGGREKTAYRLYWERSIPGHYEEFLRQDPPELSSHETIDLAFDRGWILDDRAALPTLVGLSHGAGAEAALARLFGQVLAARFDDFEEWSRLLSVEEIAEDCSRSTMHLWLAGILQDRSVQGFEPSPILKAFQEPLSALTSSLAEIIPGEIITDQFAALVSVTKEFKGKLHKAASARKIEEADSELPALLAWDRCARILNLAEERVELCVRIADLLPADHPRRLEALKCIASNATADKYREVRFRANWLLWTQFAASPDHVANAWDIAKDFSYDRVRGIVFHAYAETLTGDAYDALAAQMDPAILEDESLRGPLDRMENVPPILTPDDLSGGNMVDFNLSSGADTPMDAALCQADAELLTELAYSLGRPVWYLEAARLFLMAENPAAARSALEDLEGDHIHKSLLLLSLALADRNAQEAWEHAMRLQGAGSSLPLALSLELGSFVDYLPTAEAFSAHPDYALSVGCDIYARRLDGEGLRSWLDEQGDRRTPPYTALLARLTEVQDPAVASELYGTLLETELAPFALLSSLRCAYLLRDNDRIATGAAALNDRTPEEWLALALLRLGQPVPRIPETPLAYWYAADRGIVTRETASAQMPSDPLKARFHMGHLLETGADLTDGIRELDPQSAEWTVLERIRADYLEPGPLASRLGQWAVTPLARWWYGLDTSEDEAPLPARISAMRDKAFDTAAIPDLEEVLPGRVANRLAMLRSRTVPEGFAPEPQRDRFLAMLAGDAACADLLSMEMESATQVMETLRLLYTDGTSSSHASVLTAWFEERGGNLASAAEPLLGIMPEETVAFIAYRAALYGDLSGQLSLSLLDAAPEHLRGALLLRLALVTGDQAAIAEHVETLPEETWQEACCKALTAQLGDVELPHLFQKSDSPVAGALLMESLWRKGDWTSLNTLLLDLLTEEADEAVKRHVYSTMSRIDGEGKGDEESEMFSREALASFDRPDLYNLLRIIGYSRRMRQLQDELKAFRRLVLFMQLDQYLPGVSAELWRLDELSGLSLPDDARVLSVVDLCPTEGPVLWWAFSHLREKFPAFRLSEYFADLPDSRYLFDLAHTRQLIEGEQFEAALEMLSAAAEVRAGFLPLIDMGIALGVRLRSGAEFSRFITMLAEHFTPAEGVAHCHYLAGMALEQWSSDLPAASEQYEKVLAEVPQHREAFLRLHAIYSRDQAWDRLAGLLEHRIEVEEAVENRRRYLKDLGEIYLDHLQSEEEGLETYMKYLEEVPHEKEVLTVVCDILERLNERSLLIRYLEQSLRYEKSKTVRSALFLRAARAHDDQGEADAAVNLYIKSLEMDQSQLKVWERLYELYLEKRDHDMALRSLKRCLSLEQSMARKVDYLILMGALYEDGIQDKRNAQASFQKAVDISDGSLPAVKALAAFFDRQNDQVSKNIKLDMLWSKSLRTLEKEIRGEALNTIAHLLLYKGEKKSAQLLADASSALGVSKDVLPVEPGTQPISGEVLRHADLTPFLYPGDVKNCHRNILHLIMPEIPRVARDLFEQRPPDKKTLLDKRPSGLSDLLDQFDTPFETHRAEGDTLTVLPFESPVILVGEKYLDVEEYSRWQALLGGTLIMYERGDIMALDLSAERLFALYAAIAKTGFPQREIAGFDPEAQADMMKIAGKILSRIDRNRYQGLILEMDAISLDIARKVKEGFAVAADRASYLFTGQLGPFAELLVKRADGQRRLDDLTRFIFSTQHFKLRENAIYISVAS